MHVAWAVGTAVVAVFGGTNPAKHAPVRKPYEILQVTTGDSPAKRLHAITPEMAYDAIVRVVTREA